MYKIAISKESRYVDISKKEEPIKKSGFYAKEETEVSMSYDIRTNESKSRKIKMREIKDDGKI